MKNNIFAELKELSLADVEKRILVMQENLCRLKCNNAIKQLEDTAAVTRARKDIARAFTFKNQLIKSSQQ